MKGHGGLKVKVFLDDFNNNDSEYSVSCWPIDGCIHTNLLKSSIVGIEKTDYIEKANC